MAYYIESEECVECGACIGECPTEAIINGDDGKYKIVTSDCLDCGHCIDVCPNEAIKES